MESPSANGDAAIVPTSYNEDNNMALVVNKGATARIPYNSGYGDFCFGRRIEKPTGDEKEQLALLGQNVLFQEIGSFQRSGPFSFMKLPREVRDKIYNLLIDPFYEKSNNNNFSKTKYIKVTVKEHPWNVYQDLYGGDFNSYLEIKKMDEEYEKWMEDSDDELPPNKQVEDQQPDAVSIPSREELLKSDYERGRTLYLHSEKLHPHRSGRYHIDVRPYLCKRSRWYDNILLDLTMVELVRVLGNVSTQFRQEIGAAFWTKVKLSCNDYNLKNLIPFLRDRPATHSGIKCLRLYLDLSTDRGISNRQSLISTLKYLSTVLELDVLELEVMAAESQLLDLVEGEGELAWLQEVSSLRVSKEFRFEIDLWDILGSLYDSDDERDDYISKFIETYTPKIKRFLMPDTLRPKDLTEVDKYIASRGEPELGELKWKFDDCSS